MLMNNLKHIIYVNMGFYRLNNFFTKNEWFDILNISDMFRDDILRHRKLYDKITFQVIDLEKDYLVYTDEITKADTLATVTFKSPDLIIHKRNIKVSDKHISFGYKNI
jgi:hypothetical protein